MCMPTGVPVIVPALVSSLVAPVRQHLGRVSSTDTSWQSFKYNHLLGHLACDTLSTVTGEPVGYYSLDTNLTGKYLLATGNLQGGLPTVCAPTAFICCPHPEDFCVNCRLDQCVGKEHCMVSPVVGHQLEKTYRVSYCDGLASSRLHRTSVVPCWLNLTQSCVSCRPMRPWWSSWTLCWRLLARALRQTMLQPWLSTGTPAS